ncbi:hypothetical protein [Aquimarina aquimarini]|uniref:hypothetical protein n=1 Tax=Aquimarina aquimarini TaxID=1191734 RepID=UPI00131F387F|nr:hypothetical protein [Aquimarina aquimarini]
MKITKIKTLFQDSFLVSSSQPPISDVGLRRAKTKSSHRIIAIFFTITFLQTLIPYNQLWANNNGPNAPEAASFEPVDATDMVNLLTGDFSYVLPLLNVPSPEGGYPLALSYHGGVAHNQEASWVGLGWNLNPGSINRNVNGYPDDWGKTKYEEFFYDVGWTENEYNFSIGIGVNGFNAGLGASWGSHRSTGGFVSIGYGGASLKAGSDGATLGVEYKGFNVNVGTHGVGIGYGGNFKGSELGYGVNLNYNYSSGLSGGVSVTGANVKQTRVENRIVSRVKSGSVGVSFDSKGASLGGAINGKGIGVSTMNFGTSSNDLNIDVKGFQTSFPIYMFYIGFGHKRIRYSLYKKNDLTTSGAVYPYHANKTKPFSNGTAGVSHLMKENYFMDVNEFPAFSHEDMSLDYLIEQNFKIDKNNISLPGYDNYIVTSQGLSGSIKPASYHELNLVDRGSSEINNDNIYTAYIADNFDSYLDRVDDLGGNTHFYFENTLSSFLRDDRTVIYKNLVGNAETNASDFLMLRGFETRKSNIYSDGVLPNGEKLKYGNRKRSSNYIETFTNKQIRDNTNTTGFIEAKNIDRLQDLDTFLDEGIGAFRITSLDGKVYHYSLPVYNFELFYKNFKNPTNENQNFFEIKKTKPYATHWLLTAVTGPDYIDVNANGKVDENDYGYWVEFDYGKWTDGYVWRGPFDGYEEHQNKEDANDKTYSYYWGRKQIYYLDAVKTRTHTALFVKSIRRDNTSKELNIYKKEYIEGVFNVSEYSEVTQSGEDIFRRPILGNPGDSVYKDDGAIHILPDSPNIPIYQGNLEVYRGNRTSAKYFEAPKNKVLKLDKIILLNNDVGEISKNRRNLTNELEGYCSINNGFTNIHRCDYNPVKKETKSCEGTAVNFLTNAYLDPVKIKKFNVHQHQNVIDVKDVEGLQLEEKANQVINFNHDYSLAKKSPNSIAPGQGRLTLKSINFNGKTGKSLIPPYRFSYHMPSVQYNKLDQDDWGYHKNIPQAWSLSKIITPTGGEIEITHESDSYYSEAVYTENKLFDNIIVNKNQSSNVVEITFRDVNFKVNEYFHLNAYTYLFFKTKIGDLPSTSYYHRSEVKAKVQITNLDVQNKKVTFKILEYDNKGSFAPNVINHNIVNLTKESKYCFDEQPFASRNICLSFPSIKSTKAPILYYTDTDNNGKKGGGIRVSSIEVKGNGSNVKTVYNYTNLSNNKISGITSYAPSKEQKGIPYVSEIPAPLVTYANVTMENYAGNKFLGSTAYEFDVLKPYQRDLEYIFSIGDFFKVKKQQKETFFNQTVQAEKYTIYNKLNNLGRILSVSSYNVKGQLLSKTENNYNQNLDVDGQIGVSQQSYKSIKKVQKNDLVNYLITSSSKVDYPSIVESTKISQGGFVNTTYYDKRDFLTGQVVDTRTVSSNGTEYKTKIIPAYTQYENMGSKVDNPTNKNMLTQTTANLTQIKVGTIWKTIDAGIATWNDDWKYRNYDGTTEPVATGPNKIWRKYKTYTWKGDIDNDGTYVGYTGDLDGFMWGSTQTNPKWINTSTITMYDHYSMPLESIDINENSVSTKMGDNQSKVIAVANSKYTEMYYSGAEYFIQKNGSTYFDGEVKTEGTVVAVNDAHTGKNVVRINGGTAFDVKLPPNPNRVGEKSKFKISVWVRKGQENNVNIKVQNGTNFPIVTDFNSNENVIAGNWVLLNGYIDLSTSETKVSVSSNGTGEATDLDDFRLLPVSSDMTSYVYNNWDELTHSIGANNLATYYEYDDAGRLIKIFKEVVDATGVTGGIKLVKEIGYTYKNDINDGGNPDVGPFFSFSLGVQITGLTGRITANTYNGSGSFSYRWAVGNPGETGHSHLNFGSWNNVASIYLVDELCQKIPFIAEVRDNITGEIASKKTFYLGYCNSDGGSGNGGGDGNIGVQH